MLAVTVSFASGPKNYGVWRYRGERLIVQKSKSKKGEGGKKRGGEREKNGELRQLCAGVI